LRQAFKPWFPRLIKLWNYACSTQMPLATDGTAIGWSSGHRLNQTNPESWATASVFSYTQAIRRLVGIWTREEGLLGLNRLRPSKPPDDAMRELVERGKTWCSSGSDVGERLLTMFVNPVRRGQSDDILEPDSQPIGIQ